MKSYVVTNTKVVLETFRVEATSTDDAVRRCRAGQESTYNAAIVKETWRSAPDVSPRKQGKD